MFFNYFKIALRSILRHKVCSIINIFGLAVGMACTILILMWVQYEFSFDRYHENADRIYRLASNWDAGKWQGLYATSNHAVGPTMQKYYPEVAKACRFRPIWNGAVIQYKNKKFREEGIFYTDNSVFDIFTFPMIKGDPKSALATAHSAVITEDIAQKYFGHENPVGKAIKMTFQDWDVFGNTHVATNAEFDATVTGVIKNVPRNSHFTFNMLLSFETLYHYNKKQRGRWWGLVLFVGLIAGSYPALFLSAFQPVRIFTGRLKSGSANSHLRTVLVVTQFAISIGLIAGTVIIFYQLNYMRHKNLGFNKEHIVVLRILDDTVRQSIEPVKEELLSHSGIKGITVSSVPPGYGARTNLFLPEGFSLNQIQMMSSISADPDFVPTIGLEVVAGRNFSPEIKTDRSTSILINQTAARQFGWDDPIGKSIRELNNWNTTKTVIGVVRDFHAESLHHKIAPLLIESEPSRYRFILIKIRPENLPATLSFLEEKWKEMDPTETFDYWFLDESESFSWQYQAEQRLSQIFSCFALLAIFIACLGLFGMSSFTTEQRTKEVGIRKAMGATISSIILLLLKEFVKWILLANIIAWPIAYFAMNRWLQNFAYRINIGLSAFILAGLIVLVIAILTVSYQAIKAARANPVDALRYE